MSRRDDTPDEKEEIMGHILDQRARRIRALEARVKYLEGVVKQQNGIEACADKVIVSLKRELNTLQRLDRKRSELEQAYKNKIRSLESQVACLKAERDEQEQRESLLYRARPGSN